jgi:hypothetical protein
LEDQLDRLNKIIAMMKKHISFNAAKELDSLNVFSYGEVTVREARAL